MAIEIAETPRKTAILRPDSISTSLPPADPNSNWRHPRRSCLAKPSIIPTGPYVGLPKRPAPDLTQCLSFPKVRDLINASAYADTIGCPLNAQLTIAWRHALAFAEESWPKLQTNLFDRMSRQLKQRDICPAFVWTRERQYGKGPHTHVAIYLGRQPKRVVRELSQYLTETLKFGPEGIDIQMGKFGANTHAMRAGIMSYILKGIDHADFRYIGIGAETENIGAALGIKHRGRQGKIAIKRAGVSQSLSIASRKRAEWKELRDLVGLSERLNPTENRRI